MVRAAVLGLLFLGAAVIGACEDGDTDATTAGGAADASGGAGGEDATGAGGSGDGGAGDGGASGGAPPESGIVTVEGCADVDGLPDTCEWHYRYDAEQCSPAEPCTKLVAFWAGGEQDCAADVYQETLAAYASAGYLAACLQLFETSSESSGVEPYLDEADRVDQVLADYVGSDLSGALWSGEHLLLAGISHGATAPVIAMARTDLDDGAHWHGSTTTAGCFYDGIYDIAALDEFSGTSNAGGVCPLWHGRFVGRYYEGDNPLLHNCVNNKCACDADHAPAMDLDTIVAVDPAEYAVATFKLIECGSAVADACNGDIVPGDPIDALCTAIDASPDHTCELDPMPDDTHIECAGTGIDRCLDWFDALSGE